MSSLSLKTRLLIAIALVVVSSGLVISQAIMQQYRRDLYRNAVAEAKNIAHNISLDAADKILVNDPVSLQKLLDDQIKSHPSTAYLFISKGTEILSHTFFGGVPAELIGINNPGGDGGNVKKIVSKSGDRYIDVAWPILDGKAGVLRLGFSEKSYRTQVAKLWFKISLLTALVLSVGLVFGYFLTKSILRPLMLLTETVDGIDEKSLNVEFSAVYSKEVKKLSWAFQNMVERLKEHTESLEETANQLENKNKEIDLAHMRTKALFEIAKHVGAKADFKSICEVLVTKLQQLITCKRMVMMLFAEEGKLLFAYSNGELTRVDSAAAKKYFKLIASAGSFRSLEKSEFGLDFPEFKPAKKIGIFPLEHEGKTIGAMGVGCPGECRCVENDREIIEIILRESTGAINRAATQEKEIRNLKERVEQASGFSHLIGKDPQMRVLYKLIEDVAPTDATVLVQGESGTGKELVARSVHDKSPRGDKPFIVINCSAYPATLLESELFGHEKGAFTGAVRKKEGRFEQADGGTVFLDEIGDISATAQVKLLRVLQSKKFERIGGTETISVDVRIIAATNKDLISEVKQGNFREDLFYRLNVIPIHLPPLRKKRNDIPLLAKHFLKRFNKIQNRTVAEIGSDAMRELIEYPWPGNVRELENSMEHAVILARDEKIQIHDLPSSILDWDKSVAPPDEERVSTLEETEKAHLIDVLTICGWNKKEAARRLGIGRSTLYSKLKKYDLSAPGESD